MIQSVGRPLSALLEIYDLPCPNSIFIIIWSIVGGISIAFCMNMFFSYNEVVFSYNKIILEWKERGMLHFLD